MNEQNDYLGLRKNKKTTLKILDFIIVICIIAIIFLLILGLRSPGFTITFDSRGGTDVAPQKRMYGELLEEPEEPTREGYEFSGWYKDYACDFLWDMENDVVETEITLYAGWQ